ncbi:MAG: hypothetical protein DMG02_17350 [Acidobacteria bacterium]|nr:MAG: hypothetical protein DMG02_17350 [Acidobacteriota bacterium]
MRTPVPTSISEFVLRAATRPAEGDWLALIVPERNVPATAQAIVTELPTIAKRKVNHISEFDNPRELVRIIRHSRESLTVVSGLEKFSPVEWNTLDSMRSRLEGMSTVVFVLSERQGTMLSDNSPNIASWFAGGIWQLEDGPAREEEERTERLAAFRRATNLTDEEVVKRAEAGTLDDEPAFAEWLALLGRGDLIGPR